MLNIKEHLLACLSEECGELAQEVGKCLRFSLHHAPVEYGNGETNVQRLQKELADVIAIAELLQEHGAGINMHSPEFRARVEDKKHRTMNYGVQWARNLGTLGY